LNPDNQTGDLNFGGLSSAESSSTFTTDGIALGGGLGYNRGNLALGFDYAWRDLGLLGGTNYFSFSVGW